jgi:hypothetical protein
MSAIDGPWIGERWSCGAAQAPNAAEINKAAQMKMGFDTNLLN